MPQPDPRGLAAAVERLRQHWGGKRAAEIYPAPAWAVDWQVDYALDRLHDDLSDVAQHYLAREADDAKLIDREWLDDNVGGRIENTYLHPHADGQGRCDAIEEIGGEWWAYLACMEFAGNSAARRLNTRGDVRAFLRLARWPTKETNGGGDAEA